MSAAALFLFAAAPPTPEVEMGGLPVSVWSNLPFIVCGVFLIATLIGVLVIVRENRRVAERQMLIQSRDGSSDTEQG